MKLSKITTILVLGASILTMSVNHAADTTTSNKAKIQKNNSGLLNQKNKGIDKTTIKDTDTKIPSSVIVPKNTQVLDQTENNLSRHFNDINVNPFNNNLDNADSAWAVFRAASKSYKESIEKYKKAYEEKCSDLGTSRCIEVRLSTEKQNVIIAYRQLTRTQRKVEQEMNTLFGSAEELLDIIGSPFSGLGG